LTVNSNVAFVQSNFERKDGDRYFTQPDATSALLPYMPVNIKRVWEPAAGRGDMAAVLGDWGYDVVASDINLDEFDPGICEAFHYNFLSEEGGALPRALYGPVQAIVTNPPFGREAEAFVRQALSYEDVRYCAFLLRTVWKSASGRVDLFLDPKYHFAYEIALTWRPRWDWWFREKPEKSPMHNYSWFVWDREWEGRNTTFWATKNEKALR
jgi:hypothetical protein